MAQPWEVRLRKLEDRLAQVEGQGSGSYSSTPSGRPPSTSSPGQSPDSSAASSTQAQISAGFSLRLLPQSTVDIPHLSVDRARQLWQIYQTDIDPLLKIVNRQYVENALLSYPGGPPHRKSLLLAVSFAAVACKQPGLTPEYLGHARAVESALQSANVLSKPSISTLQALTIYLICGRLNMDQDYLRCMLALLVQLATKLKLDEDPEKLGIYFSEAEHRRRLWWHIVALDVRTAEQCGTDPIISSRLMRTKMPSMLSDSTLDSTAVLTPSSHAPSTFYTIVAFEMAKAAREVLLSLDSGLGAPAIDNKEYQIALSEQLHGALFNKYIRQCSCANSPVCRMTTEWYCIYSARLKLLVLHDGKVFLRKVSSDYASDPETDLLACIDLLNRVQVLRAHPEYSRWAWLWQNPVEWDVAAIALCAIATGSCTAGLVHRAWVAIDSFFETWTGHFGDPAHRRRWRALQTFRDWVRATKSRPVDTVQEMDFDPTIFDSSVWER